MSSNDMYFEGKSGIKIIILLVKKSFPAIFQYNSIPARNLCLVYFSNSLKVAVRFTKILDDKHSNRHPCTIQYSYSLCVLKPVTLLIHIEDDVTSLPNS